MASPRPNRPIRIAGCSGAATDRRHALAHLAANHPTDPVDVITGDWMSEANMTSRAALKTSSAADDSTTDAYEPTFLESLEPALSDLARYGIKVAVNAGASDTELLYRVVTDMVKAKGLDLKVAWVSGDEVLPAVEQAQREGANEFTNICTGEKLAEWNFKPIYAQAYLGGLGIAAALAEGADIVVCGRVSDASPVIGAAYWWHKWQRTQLHELANALIAGHLIECSTYICGGNFTGFKTLATKGWHDLGYPIAEISSEGAVIITKSLNSGGALTTQTCSSQLLYEIQGPWYFNSDVTAYLPNLTFTQLGPDRVALTGIQALPSPPTTKIGLTAPGGYQAEIHYFLTGLDVAAKAAMLEAQARHNLTPYIKDFTRLTFTLHGSALSNPQNQNEATVDLRIFAQARTAEALSPMKFFRPVGDNIMQTYPGATFHLDLRQAFPKPIYEYYVTLLPQSSITHRAHLWDGRDLEIPAPMPAECKLYPSQQPSQPSTAQPSTLDFGPTTFGPLGWLVHARSGDKGSNCNVGFFVPHGGEEWEWLRSLLSVQTIRKLLADEDKGKKIVCHPVPPRLSSAFDRGISHKF